MANTESPQAKFGLPTKNVKSPDHREIYSNNVRIALTAFDLALMIGHICENAEGENIILEEATLRLSPQFCKTLSINLANIVATWEAQFGVIPISNKTPQAVFEAVQAAIAAKKV